MSPLRGSRSWIQAIAESSEGIVIGTRINAAIQLRPGIAVRSHNQANKIARGRPTAKDPTVNSIVFRKIGSVAGLVSTAT